MGKGCAIMKNIAITNLLLCLFFPPIALSEISIGKITKMKGSASVLYPGAREAIKATQRLDIKKDTSILTEDKSFVQVTLLDHTKIMIGPKSKVTIDKLSKGNSGIVGLLIGKIRTQTNKNSSSGTNEKLVIKTRTAALGVRGTDFQTLYNPENEITSLLTFKGSVAISKVKNNLKREDNDSIIQSLRSKNVTYVNEARFSTVTSNLDNATSPIKISPEQFIRLKINDTFEGDKNISKEQFKIEYKKTLALYEKIAITEENTFDSQREFNIKKGIYRPRSGGVLDLETGFYIPPNKNGMINKKLNIVVDHQQKIDQSGFFKTPEGLILDPRKGFVADPQSSEKISQSELRKKNTELAGQMIRPQKPTREELNNLEKDAYEKYFKIE